VRNLVSHLQRNRKTDTLTHPVTLSSNCCCTVERASEGASCLRILGLWGLRAKVGYLIWEGSFMLSDEVWWGEGLRGEQGE
jgi:hypothetical protein